MAPLDDKESQQVLSTLIKQRKDSIEQFTKGGRQEMADKEAAEIKLIETYLPKAAGEDEIVADVRAAIAEMTPPHDERYGHGHEGGHGPLRRRWDAGRWQGSQRGGEEGVGGEVGITTNPVVADALVGPVERRSTELECEWASRSAPTRSLVIQNMDY